MEGEHFLNFLQLYLLIFASMSYIPSQKNQLNIELSPLCLMFCCFFQLIILKKKENSHKSYHQSCSVISVNDRHIFTLLHLFYIHLIVHILHHFVLTVLFIKNCIYYKLICPLFYQITWNASIAFITKEFITGIFYITCKVGTHTETWQGCEILSQNL